GKGIAISRPRGVVVSARESKIRQTGSEPADRQGDKKNAQQRASELQRPPRTRIQGSSHARVHSGSNLPTGAPERAVRLRSTRRNRKLVGEVASRKARRSCPRFFVMIGINPGRTIKSRPGSLYGMAIFRCVLDRFSDVIVT